MAGTDLRSADLLVQRLKDEKTLEAVAADNSKLDEIAVEVKKVADSGNAGLAVARALESDRTVYRMTTLFLGAAVTLCVIGILVLGYSAKTVPDSLVAIASTAVGALAGLLAPLGSRAV